MSTRRSASLINTDRDEGMAGSGGSGGDVGASSSGHHSRSNSSRRSTALSGITSTVDEKNIDFLCPICFELISEAHITKCGHTFCYQCIIKSIETTKRCPKCCFTLPGQEMIFPNFLLNELVAKERLKIATAEQLIGADMSVNKDVNKLKDLIARDSHNLTLPDVDVMLEILQHRRQLLETETCIAQNRLLQEFLQQLMNHKEDQRDLIEKEIDLIRRDLNEVECILTETESIQRINKRNLRKNCSNKGDGEENPHDGDHDMEDEGNEAEEEDGDDEEDEDEEGAKSDTIDTTTTPVTHRRKIRRKNSSKQKVPELPQVARSTSLEVDNFTGFNTHDQKTDIIDSFAMRKRRMYSHFEDFVSCYFQSRSQDLYFGSLKSIDQKPHQVESDVKAGGDPQSTNEIRLNQEQTTVEEIKAEKPRRMSVKSRIGLDEFRESLVKFSRYSSCKTLATLGYSSDLSNGSIVSSIEFDKDNEFFAIAGVTKRIKIYDYLAVIRDVVDIHYPVVEMVSNSKISCVAWNSYHKNILASSDYDGTVTIWDAVTGQRTKFFQEHDKRCWSVDFNDVDSRLVASGSDDGRMKLWSLLSNNSVATLDTKANICCVKFNPKSSCHIAFGSADHCVHYYDLRNTRKPLCVFTGHQKAVSYVKFLNESEIVSASTDSHLRLWNVNSPPYSKRSYIGHINEKNFVGLATDGEYITCGSEDISLYVYYKGLPKPLFNLKMDRPTANPSLSITNDSNSSDLNEFVSAVCWRKNCNVMIAANSRGIVKVLELI